MASVALPIGDPRVGPRPSSSAAVERAVLAPHSEQAEVAVLGTVLLTAKALPMVLTEAGLTPEDFYRPRHQLIWAAMCALQDAGEAVDAVTVVNHLAASRDLDQAGGAAYVHSLPVEVPSAGAVLDYARIVKTKTLWRLRLEAARAMEAAVRDESEEGIAAAERMLTLAAAGGGAADSFDPDQLAEDMYDYIDEGGVEAFPLPLRRLSSFPPGGGLHRGGLTILGGHTSHGKSAMLDQALDAMGDLIDREGRRLRPWLYLTEMDQRERTARTLARRTGIPHERIQSADLTEDEKGTVARELNSLPFGITVASGWSTLDLVRHARHQRFDVIGVDCLHDLPYPDGMSRAEGLGWVAAELKRMAVMANCHVIATVWLSEKGVLGKVRPEPTQGDIRDSGMIKNRADNLLFVWQDQDPDTGRPLGHGLAYWAKCRGGQLGGSEVVFNGQKMRFVEANP